MSLEKKHKELLKAQCDYTQNWPLFVIKKETLVAIENGSKDGDSFLLESQKVLHEKYTKIKGLEDYDKVCQLYEEYVEAYFYILMRKKGVKLQRTSGTGGTNQKRPDFEYPLGQGRIYFELKAIDFKGGKSAHKELANKTLESNADLSEKVARRRKSGKSGVDFGEPVEIPNSPAEEPAARIDAAIDKISSNIKLGQINYGPTILVVDFGRFNMDSDDPSSLTPVYLDDFYKTCASGELWNIAFGRIGDQIYRRVNFEGQSNLDNRLEKEGILNSYNQLLGLTFLIPRLKEDFRLFSIYKNISKYPDFENCPFSEHDLGGLICKISDAMNDCVNSRCWDKQIRKA